MRRAPIRTIPSHGTRLRQHGAGEAPLESVAAEFALLAQRRARVARQIELLDRQRVAAGATLRLVEARLHHLSRRMALPTATAQGASQATSLRPAPA
ncbi:hypothetical protein, partial [Paracraurococcus ruber]